MPSEISNFEQSPDRSKEKLKNLGSIISQGSVSSIQFADGPPIFSAHSSKSKQGILKGTSNNNVSSTQHSSNVNKLRSILHRYSEIPSEVIPEIKVRIS